MNRPAAWAASGALVGTALATFLSGASRELLELARALPGPVGGAPSLEPWACSLRAWIPAGTALGLAAGMLAGVVTERPAARVAGSARAPFGRSLVLAGVVAVGLAAWVVARAPGHGGGSGAVADGPNLVLVVLDTTRRDRLSLYGYERETTPELERLARSATVFERAFAASSWTSPSHASLFTGRHPLGPEGHGVTQAAWDLPQDELTLAERLAARGYRTAGFVGNPMVGRRLGFDQGFATFEETWREAWQPEDGSSAHPALLGFERLLAEQDPRPFFAFFNFIEPHSPYTSIGSDPGGLVRDATAGFTQNHWRAWYRGQIELAPEALAELSERYDAELRTTDALVGSLVDALEARGLLERTALVVTADHGENLGEHGMLDHVFSLYQETVAVPLLVRFPERFGEGVRDDRPAQLVDVFATLAGLGGLELGSAGLVGRDLRGPPDPGRELLLSYDYPHQALRAIGEGADDPALDRYRRRLFALVRGELKAIVSDDGSVELYDLARDPREESNLAASEDPRFAPLVTRARELLAQGSRRAADAGTGLGSGTDARTLEELKKLGYAE